MGYGKSPSAGTKVTLGESAPVRREPAGNVDPDSLAAESYAQGGGFASNRGGAPESANTDTDTTSSFESINKKSKDSPTTSSSNHNERTSTSHAPEMSGNGGTAPSYVTSQYIRDPNPPHGKNIREVETFEGEGKLKDGLQAAFRAEPGSEDDPSRFGERKTEHQGNTTTEKGENSGLAIDGTGYDTLDAERNI